MAVPALLARVRATRARLASRSPSFPRDVNALFLWKCLPCLLAVPALLSMLRARVTRARLASRCPRNLNDLFFGCAPLAFWPFRRPWRRRVNRGPGLRAVALVSRATEMPFSSDMPPCLVTVPAPLASARARATRALLASRSPRFPRDSASLLAKPLWGSPAPTPRDVSPSAVCCGFKETCYILLLHTLCFYLFRSEMD